MIKKEISITKIKKRTKFKLFITILIGFISIIGCKKESELKMERDKATEYSFIGEQHNVILDEVFTDITSINNLKSSNNPIDYSLKAREILFNKVNSEGSIPNEKKEELKDLISKYLLIELKKTSEYERVYSKV